MTGATSWDTGAPLEGMRVVEGGSFVAVPSGAMTLAMLGAEVIRFDPLGGGPDHRRSPLAGDGTSLYWASLNKGKRSIAIDLRSEQGAELAAALVTAPGEGSGMFVTNTPGRGPLADDALAARRADLITVRLSGYPDGAPAVDYTVNWETGFPTITGPADGGPANHALPAWDLIAGGYVATALLAAERRRSRTGRGERVSLSLSDVALATTDHLGYFAEVQVTGTGRDRAGDFVYGTFGAPFPTSDGGTVMVVALTTRQWEALVGLTGTAAPLAAVAGHLDADLALEEDRYRLRGVIHTLLAPWFAARTTGEVLEAAREARLLASRLQDFAECFASPRVADNPLFAPVEHATLGGLVAAGAPPVFAEAAARPDPVAPVLGSDTSWVLSSVLGLSDREIGTLHDRGVVASAATAARGENA